MIQADPLVQTYLLVEAGKNRAIIPSLCRPTALNHQLWTKTTTTVKQPQLGNVYGAAQILLCKMKPF